MTAGGGGGSTTHMVFNALISLTFVLIAHVLIKKEMLHRSLATDAKGGRNSSSSATAVGGGGETETFAASAAAGADTDDDDDELMRYINDGEEEEEEEEEEVVATTPTAPSRRQQQSRSMLPRSRPPESRLIRESPREMSINDGVVFEDMGGGLRGTYAGVPRTTHYKKIASSTP